MTEVIAIPAFKDNYIWMLVHREHKACVVVDPGMAEPVIAVCREKQLVLKGILVTHHHFDHCGGVEDLLSYQTVPVYGGERDNIPGCDYPVGEGSAFRIHSIEADFKVLSIPGHTLGHVAYVSEDKLFCGDTLFTGGCGRLFEGTPEQMHASLAKLKALPPTTQVYCGHEYTLNNLLFAKTLEPENTVLLKRLEETQALRQSGKATVPSSLQLELETNPFLRTHVDTIKKAAKNDANRMLEQEIEVFAVIRDMKNRFTL